MKKTLTSLLLCVAGLSTTAAHAAWQSNWLVGASGGYASAKGPFNLTILDTNGRQNVFNHTYKDSGFLAGLLAGYQARCQRWLFGLELNADWRDLDRTHDFAQTLTTGNANGVGFTGTVEYDREWALALTGRVGYAVAPYLMPYLRVGVEGAEDELTVTGLINNTNAPFEFDDEDWTYRLVAGIGVEVPLAMFIDGLTARAEYDYHHRGQGVTARANIFNGALVAGEMKERNQTGRISVVWNFG